MSGDDERKKGETTFNLTGGFGDEAGSPQPPARYLQPGTMLAGNYSVQSVVGEGGQ